MATQQQARQYTPISEEAFFLHIMQRALARPAGDILERFRQKYEAKARQIAERIIAAGC